MPELAAILAEADGGLKASLGRLFELLRFATVATDAAYHGDCRRCAAWLQDLLGGLGFQANLRETTGQPLVVARSAPDGLPPHAPHILFYGHYDVQPADPLELWTSPPFEPTIGKNRHGEDAIFARGAGDDKGQFMTFLEASRAWLKVKGALPFRLTVLIEGDEEGDNSHLERFLKANAAEFACDALFVCDTGMWDRKTPALSTRLRGCVSEEVWITGPKKDLHSGYFGGAVRNPIHVLTAILGQMHDAKGRVTIPGFYKDVVKVSPEQRAAWGKLKFDGRSFLKAVGLSEPAGEQGYSVLEQIWIRPTAEVNGITGGYGGPGGKTVLPSTASAKLTFRLVGGQNPKQVRRAFRAFVRDRLPADCKARFEGQGGDSSGIAVSEKSPWIAAASRALQTEWGRAPVMKGSGGSIPVVETFKSVLGAEAVMAGFARGDDAFHSPNEKYDVECFHKGIRSWIRIIDEVAKL